MAVDPWDSDPTQQKEQPHDELAEKAARATAAQRSLVLSDVNATPTRPELDSLGRYVYDTAPVPIKRMFASPLAMLGPNAIGKNGERKVSSGWGDARSTGYDRNVNTATQHHALDFVAPYGEEVFASAPGKAVFVGFQSRRGAVTVKGVTTNDAREEILNDKGLVVGSKALGNIGFGGVCIYIQHSHDFQGYKTGYFHLSDTHINEGDLIEEGQLIGNIGGTGGYYSWYHKGYHLHYQIEYASGGLKAIVRPTAIVPNRWPGHQDSTNSSQAADLLMPLVASVGGQAAASRVANVLSSINRSTTIQNKDIQDVRQDQSDYAAHVAQTIDMQRTAVYASSAAFQGNPPVVTSPMTFDFVNGVWLVNGKDNGAV